MTNPSQPAPDVADWCQQGSWRRLAAFAHTLVLDAEAQAGTRMSPLLGGGTRLMLALQHRISHDIDLFIRDGRGEIGNSKIGEILSAAKPVPGRPWPPELVREIIEMVRSRALEQGFETGVYNRRGVTVRLPHDGGKLERDLAARYRTDAEAIWFDSHRTSACLSRIAEFYDSDAEREDLGAEQNDLL